MLVILFARPVPQLQPLVEEAEDVVTLGVVEELPVGVQQARVVLVLWVGGAVVAWVVRGGVLEVYQPIWTGSLHPWCVLQDSPVW